MSSKPFSFKERLRSFHYAWEGFRFLLKDEHNFRIHFMAMLFAIAFGFYFRISSFEWIALILAISGVLVSESINTSIEKLSDLVSPDFHPLVKIAKDVAAFAVLLTVLVAIIVGGIIFLPKIF